MKKILFTAICIFISLVLFIFSFSVNERHIITAKNASNIPQTIIIDAGHGGFDGGAIATDGTLEKDINLKIAENLQEYLAIFGFKTIMTRDDDSSTEDEGLTTIREKKKSDLHNRMKLMEETDNAIFISIHQNKYEIEKYKGTQVFYSPQTRAESSILAQCIQDSVVNTIQKDNNRQIKECGTSVYLIHNALKPAVLIECGFLSNYEETQKLKSTEYQKKIAFCIAMGIQNYLSARNE